MIIWILGGIIIVWLTLLTVLVFGVCGTLQIRKTGQGEINTQVEKRYWYLDERVTMLNDRVNNMKMKFK